MKDERKNENEEDENGTRECNWVEGLSQTRREEFGREVRHRYNRGEEKKRNERMEGQNRKKQERSSQYD
ncbi:hypothetical protein PRIPAC_96798 [Pristionchus pacificus]|uniref:Uncharacterized protein n=1 Tax=Pristionchus pacificus TaxID=54126 RepID=A0A2A6D147_PRIPA|nr:hypothetical protein PRIPAC_96798 [Pristionchus pacificus]|eukprot:PDM84135.1 hypothetical protein PRIPAC_34327 [Pristionchus pacificus]